jgi:hypothetical protein
MRGPANIRAALSGALAAFLLACGGGGGGEDGVVTRLLCAGTVAPAPDLVTLGCPAEATDAITISVHLGGPTTSSNVYGLKFDLVFDPAVVQFEPPAVEGNFLKRDGAATIMQASAAPGDPGRVIVAITRQGVANGLQAVDADNLVIVLLLRGVAAGGTTVAFENAEVIDSSLQSIPAIQFGTALTLDFN